ncbi:hypothetical protein GGR54DRAFT_649212 [Hypoxylon sp. NC1633]|nr:hypothetical protein GGR54DRAFT_649212 [Hypoxylon sp. NC1633]
MLRHAFRWMVVLLATSSSQARLDHVRLDLPRKWNSTTTPSPTSFSVSGVTSSPTSGLTTDKTTNGATILQQTTTSDGQTQILPVMVGGIFTSPVTLKSPDPTPLDPTGEPAKSSAKTISSYYSSVSAEINSWLQTKDQAHATDIHKNLQKILPEIGSMVYNLPDGDEKIAKSDCQGTRKKRSITNFVERDLLGSLFGSLNDMLCSTTSLINSFAKVAKTTDQDIISGLAKNVQTVINTIKLEAFVGIITGGGDGGENGGGDDNQGKSTQTKSTSSSSSSSSSSSTSSSSSSTSSCTKTITATYESVFCTRMTASAPSFDHQNCSSLVYSTATGCSELETATATTTTTTTQVQTTPYVDLCSPGTCGGRECSKKRSLEKNLEKRDWESAPYRVFPVPDGEWAQPSTYGGDYSIFIRGEVYLAYNSSLADGPRWGSVDVSEANFDENYPTTSNTTRWTEVVNTVAMIGMFGCTSVIVVSKRGAWVAHMWETPSFTGKELEHGYWYTERDEYNQQVRKLWPPTFETKEERAGRFAREVLGSMHRGNSRLHAFGLDELRGGPPLIWADTFDADAEPEAWIITPRPKHPEDDTVPYQPRRFVHLQRYTKMVTSIEEELRSIFVGAQIPITVHDYYPWLPPVKYRHKPGYEDHKKDTKDEVQYGKILLQYQPAPRCGGGLAEYRLFFESEMLWLVDFVTGVANCNNNPKDNNYNSNPDNNGPSFAGKLL